MKNNRLFFHVGCPKTATTTFQKHIYPNHPDILYLGKFIPSFKFKSSELGIELNRLIRNDGIHYKSNGKLFDAIYDLVGENDDRAILISSESMVDGWASDRAQVAHRIRQQFEDCKIIITIREQLSVLRSYYYAHGRYGYNLFLTNSPFEKPGFPMKIDNWLNYSFQMFDKNITGTLMYFDLVSCYKRLFGEENVVVLLFEEFVHSPDKYFQKLSAFMGVRNSEFQYDRDKHFENPNMSGVEKNITDFFIMLGIKPEVNRLKGGYMNFTKYLYRKFGHGNVEIRDEWKEKIYEQYHEQNKKLRDEYGLPVEDYGYCI